MRLTKETVLLGSAALAFSALLPTAASAHHPMGGAMPTTFLQGFLSGVGHPIIGVDHLAFIIGVGLLAAIVGYRFLLPLAFIAATAVGTGIHLMSMDLPIAETIIAASVAVAGLLIITQSKLPAMLLAAGFAMAGVFHGFAYGEAVFGAEASVIGAYLLGFCAIQYAIAVGAGQVFLFLTEKEKSWGLSYANVVGGVLAGVSMVIFSDMMFPV